MAIHSMLSIRLTKPMCYNQKHMKSHVGWVVSDMANYLQKVVT